MMNIIKVFKFIALPSAISLLMLSCAAREKYQRPAGIAEQTLYRTDLLPKDSLGTGAVSWRQIFTDPILQQHIQRGLDNNLDIRVAYQNILSADAVLKQSKVAYFPSLSVGPQYSLQSSSLNTPQGALSGGRSYASVFGLGASVSWEADIWGRLAAQARAQVATYLGTVAAHQAVKSELVAAIASDYYQLLNYDEQKKILNRTIEIRKKNLETTEALKLAGTLTEVAVQQSQALVYNAEAMLITLDNQIVALENSMSVLLAEAPHHIERGALQSQSIPDSFDLGYPSALLANRPDVRQAEYRLQNAFELTNAANAAFYPTLSITGSGGLQATDFDKLFSAQSWFSSIAAGLLAPVFNKRQIRTNYEVSLANKEAAYLQFRKTVLSAGAEVSSALQSYHSQDEFIALKEKELANYTNAVNYSQELVNYGMANYLEVLNANVNAVNAELNIANAKFTKLNSAVQLYRALGGGWR